MSAHRHVPLAPRGPVPLVRRSTLWVFAIVAIAAFELAGAVVAPAAMSVGGPGGGAAAAPTGGSSATPAASPTHGDLNVTSGQTVYIPGQVPPPVPSTYYQGGNITVQAGGTLIVQNVTLSFVQFIGTSGTPLARLSHVFKFIVKAGGTAIFKNATLTTDAFLVNPYVKLDVVDDGALTFWHSNVETAGFLNVGPSGDLTLNSSSLGPNPAVGNLNLATSTLGDLGFAPTLTVSGAGTANLFSSVDRDLYADNLVLNGTPNPEPLTAAGLAAVGPGTNWNTWSTPTDPGSLIQDYLYPSGVGGGVLVVDYNDVNNKSLGNTTLTISITYNAVSYTVGTHTFAYSSAGTLNFSFPQALVNAINNNGGMMGWLNRTGDFGPATGISIQFAGAGPAFSVPLLQLQPVAPLNFGLSLNQSRSALNSVDSYIGLTFAPSGAEPWATHQLTLGNGSRAYLANLTTAGTLQNGSSQAGLGAIVADATSDAYLLRWAAVQAYGKGGALPVPGTTVAAQYAYSSSQLDNATANNLVHNISTYDPAIWAYLQYWDSVHGAPAYGESGLDGIAAILVASNNISGPSGPDGDYLGDYHVVVTPPAGAGTPAGFTALVSPYPLGVANGSQGYGVPDAWGTFDFPLYYATAALSARNGVVVTADSVTATSIRIGQLLGVAVNVSDNGPAPLTLLNGTLYYNATSRIVLATALKHVDLTAPGQNATLAFTWRVNDSVVGLHGKPVADNLSLVVTWNLDLPSEGGGQFASNQTVQFAPSQVKLAGLSTPPTHLTDGDSYLTIGTLTYNGSQAAYVRLLATDSGGTTIVLATSSVGPAAVTGHPVTFELKWTPDALTKGKGYTLTVSALYNGVYNNVTLGSPLSFSVPAPSAASFFTEKVLGLPIWLWIAIAAAAVAGIVGFLLWSRQRAAGKLVECGECGNLVPEDAKVCPKCGAEFETDVVRCSRCASTIPASSQFCPECAAQLLGKPGEGGADPERQAYADFTERYRAEGKKELGDNYSEGAFWDWWKRQPSYTPFSQWKVQQGQGTPRAGMTAPPPAPPSRPPGGATPGAPAPRRPAGRPPAAPPPGAAAPAAAVPTGAAAAPAPPAPSAPGALKPCPNCGKEIPPEYLVCPFCGSVTQ